MTDIHTHILPDIDDGAEDVNAAIEILSAEMQQGVKQIVFTPHYYGRKRSPAQFLARRQAAFEKIQPLLPEGVEVRLGAEVYFTGINMPESDELCKLALEGTKYVLFEFPFSRAWTEQMFNCLNQFINDTRYTPIVAHIERYHEVWENPSIVSELVHMGCLIQVNSGAFLDKREKRLAFALLKHGLVHCLGSDTHDTIFRAPDYAKAKLAFEKAGYAKEWDMIQDNMKEMLSGERLSFPVSRPVKKRFGRYV
ncbi:MAG: hypothetical protein IJX75_03585 [Clostridia bacterium]|nr:hypothetical protein [Clostridia bacterium]